MIPVTDPRPVAVPTPRGTVEGVIIDGPDRVMGLETEYGLHLPGRPHRSAQDRWAWRILARLRGSTPGQQAPSSVWASDGTRIYVDTGDHPEVAVAEHLDPFTLAADTERWHRILAAATARLPEPAVLVATNVTFHEPAVTWGRHENYRVARRPDERTLVALASHLATRSRIAGAGWPPLGPGEPWRLVSRAEHIHTISRSAQTSFRGMVAVCTENLDPGADPEAGAQRLAALCGDTTVSVTQTALVVGTTHLVLRVLEEDPDSAPEPLADPVAVLRSDTLVTDPLTPTGGLVVRTSSGRRIRTLEVQERWLETAARLLERRPHRAWEHRIIGLWAQVIDATRTDPSRLVGTLDWATRAWMHQRETDRGAGPLRAAAAAVAATGVLTAEPGVRWREPDTVQGPPTPPPTRAATRAGFMVTAHHHGHPITVEWTRVRTPWATVQLHDPARARYRPAPYQPSPLAATPTVPVPGPGGLLYGTGTGG